MIFISCKIVFFKPNYELIFCVPLNIVDCIADINMCLFNTPFCNKPCNFVQKQIQHDIIIILNFYVPLLYILYIQRIVSNYTCIQDKIFVFVSINEVTKLEESPRKYDYYQL